jgi:hypothetical protein
MKRIIEWLRSLFREEPASPIVEVSEPKPAPKRAPVKRAPRPKAEAVAEPKKKKTEAKPRGTVAPKKAAPKKTTRQK